jgi:hypothetical protein
MGSYKEEANTERITELAPMDKSKHTHLKRRLHDVRKIN